MPRREEFTAGAPELVAWCVGQTVGCITVLRAEYSSDADHHGEAAVFLDLTVTDPAPWDETWPLDDFLGLCRLVDAKARDLLATDNWYVRLHPANPRLERGATAAAG